MNNDYKPRFSFEVTENQRIRANKYLATYGLRKAIFSPILDDVLDMIEEYGGVAIGVMMSKETKIRDIIPTMKQADLAGKNMIGGK